METKYFATDDLHLYYFENVAHLRNHVNYLIHADATQKFTNEQSVGNLTILNGMNRQTGHLDMHTIPWLEDVTQRKELAKKIVEMYQSDLESLLYTRIECRNPDVLQWDKEMLQEVQLFVDDLVKNHYIPVVIQIHDDQPECYCHFHVIVFDAN